MTRSLTVRAAPSEHFAWIRERTQCVVGPDFRAIEAVDAKGRIRGMVGFDGWWGNAAQMHVALDTPTALRALLGPAFDYVFNQCGKSIALGVVPSHNEKALAFDQHIGFREVHRVKDGWAPGDDVVFLELRKENCRWLRRKGGVSR